MSERASLPGMGVSGKVSADHVRRLAVVYVRQSTMVQVREHPESARLQYDLSERAAGLGWSPSRVLVIDEDMGHSASGVQQRPGFTRLVSEVGLGHVGIVLGIEMSRLARSGRDWHQLLELCALSRTLLGDPQAVYDPTDHNDRLLLGLKGTISEAELWLIKQRMWGGRIAKARRGELAVDPPMGYLRRPSGEIVLDPDAQVQAVIRLVFAKFVELGTLHAVLSFMVAHGIMLGGRQLRGVDRGELVWRRPHQTLLRNMIHNPIYAGVYAYGRSRDEYRAGRRHTRAVNDPADWLVYLPDRLPAYISVEQWRRNLATLAANRTTAASAGSPRAGTALLSGLLFCARCQRRMLVTYPSGGNRQIYHCRWEHDQYGGASCQQLASACLDAYVAELVLAAIAPAGLQASLAAAERIERDRAAVDGIWRQRLERADYTVDKARRCYRLVEPENRLVVRQLEADWEHALAERETLGEQYARYLASEPPTLSPAERATIAGLATDLHGLWQAKTTTNADRKRLIRLVIDKLTVNVIGESELVDVIVTWAGGHTTPGQVVRPVARLEQLSYYPQFVARIQQLAATGMSAKRIAEQINAEGFRPPKRADHYSPGSIQMLMRRLGLHQFPGRSGHRPDEQLGEHEWRLPDLAAVLDMPQYTLSTWVKRGWVHGRRDDTPHHSWILHADPDTLAELRQRRQRPNGYYNQHRFLNNQTPPTEERGDHDRSPQ